MLARSVFLLFVQCFQKAPFSGSLKVRDCVVNSLPNKKIWALSKLTALADNKFNSAEMLISLFDRVENIVGKRENTAVNSIFPFSLIVFKRLLSQGR